MQIVGIDLGGTKIEGVVCESGDLSRPLCRLRLPTEGDQGYEHILGQIVKLHQALAREVGGELPPVVGIGTPGSLDLEAGTLQGSNTQCLNNRPFKADLEKILDREVRMANDANCFALAESLMGAAKGYETVFGIIMGTGCGGGLVVNGKIINGRHGIAGEWGQIVLDPEGPVSKYGTRGTVETFLSGPYVEAFYEEQSGRRLSLKEINELARAGTDPAAIMTVEHLTDSFAEALNMVLNIFDPHAVVIGGGVGNVGALYEECTREKIERIMFAPPLKTAILRPQLGDSAGVFGAAMLAM